MISENPTGLARREILESIGLKGDKAGEMLVSKRADESTQVSRRENKYGAAGTCASGNGRTGLDNIVQPGIGEVTIPKFKHQQGKNLVGYTDPVNEMITE